MFENYPMYARQVIKAAQNMSADQKARHGKVGIASVSTLMLGGIVMMASGNALAAAQIDVAMGVLKTGFEDDSVSIEVESATEPAASLLAEEARPLSASTEAAVVQQVKDCISADKLVAAEAKIIDAETTEVTVTTADQIPVKVTLKKQTDGTYKIDSAKAVLDAKAIRERKAAAANPTSSEVQREAHAAPLTAFDESVFETVSGLEEGADDAAKDSLYTDHMSVIAPNVVLTVPAGFASQEVEQPAEQAEDAIDDIVDAAVNEAAGEKTLTEAEKAKAERSSVKQYARSWKDGSGSTISVRAENLGDAFSSMTGLDAVTKMRGYWEETSGSVATGAGQELKNPEEGYVVEVFYDKASGMWGYWGHVVYTDGSRDIVYNRVVFIDEIADQMFTISYRNDSEVSSESKAYTLDDFKKIITARPGATAAVAPAVTDVVENIETINALADGFNMAAAPVEETPAEPTRVENAYEASLAKILILPGHSKTVEVEAAEAEEAKKAAEEEAKKAKANPTSEQTSVAVPAGDKPAA